MDESLVQRVELLADIFCELKEETFQSPLDVEEKAI